MKNNKSIKLIVLIGILIVLIICVSIKILMGDNGIITKLKENKKIQEVATILEKLDKIAVEMGNNYIVTLDKYLNRLQEEKIINKEDIVNYWNVGIGNVYIEIDDYNFLLEQQENNIKINLVEEPVILKLDTQVNVELGTINVDVLTINEEDSKYEYSIREENGDYTVKETSTNTNYTFEGLDASKQYYIRVIVVDDNGMDEKIKPVYTSVTQPGTYISYTPTTKEFKMTTDQTGYEEEQQFSTGDYKGKWIVLYNDTQHGVQIISEDIVENLYLLGKVGYNKAIDTLNEFCSNYEDATLSQGSRIVGTDPINSEDLATGNVEFMVEFNGSKDSGLKTPDANYTEDYQVMSQIGEGIYDIGKYYWLGNRKAYHNSEVGYFSIYTLSSDGNVEYRRMVDMYSNLESGKNVYEYKYAYGVRPVIKFDINSISVASGTGSESDPFVLKLK